MHMKIPSANNGGLLEAREQRLMAFAAAGIERFSELGEGVGSASVLAVARSADSPVVRALVALKSALETSKTHVTVRLVISEDDIPLDPFLAGSTEPSGACRCEVRVVRDPRLRDAHEQLVVGGASVWFGDSLRRDIHRRDLFEQYLADAPEAARAAGQSFQQLWMRAEPCLSLPALASDSLTAVPGHNPGNTDPTGTILC